MARRVLIQPLADRDLDDHAENIGKDNLSAALRLYDAAEATFAFLSETPFAGGLCNFQRTEARDLRIWRIKGFPNHLIIYRVSDEAVNIVRVLHAARDRDQIFEN